MPTITTTPTTCKVETCIRYGQPIMPPRSECPTCHTATIAWQWYCPDWCEEDHQAERDQPYSYIDWPIHEKGIGTVKDASVSITASELEPVEYDGRLRPEVMLHASSAMLDAKAARKLAGHLIEAAEWFEQHSPQTEGQTIATLAAQTGAQPYEVAAFASLGRDWTDDTLVSAADAEAWLDAGQRGGRRCSRDPLSICERGDGHDGPHGFTR